MYRFAVLFVLLLLCRSAKTQNAEIAGTIYAKSDLSRLISAQLVLFKDHKYCQKTTVDHLGNYWFAGLDSGAYSIQVYHKGYCKIQLLGILVAQPNANILYDIGMMNTAADSNVPTQDFVHIYYKGAFKKELVHRPAALANYVESHNIIEDVYQGPSITIRPRRIEKTSTSHKATHFTESLQALQKTPPNTPSSGF